MAAAFALIGVFLGWRPLVIILGALGIVYVGLWWLTEQSQSKFGKEHRAWREERAMKPIREEADKVRGEAQRLADEAKREGEEAKQWLWFFHGS